MTTMIERMARAIADELGRQDGYDAPAWKLEDGLKLAWLDQGEVDMGLVAKAALTAMLEPTEAMAASVITEPSHLYDDGLRGTDYQRDMKNAVLIERAVLISHFREMVQAALDEKEG